VEPSGTVLFGIRSDIDASFARLTER
jgi:hypothetical protein